MLMRVEPVVNMSYTQLINMTKLFFQPVISSVLSFLTPSEYGKLLCTCREAAQYDYKFVWVRYTHVNPRREISKPLALLSDILRTNSPGTLLHNTTNKKNMRLLLDCLRLLVNHVVLANVYKKYLTNNQRSRMFDSMVRMENILVGGSKCNKTRARRLRR